MIIGIVCVDEKNWGIGLNGKMLFDLKEDLEFFKQKTEKNIVVMGHKTFDSLPDTVRPLPNRTNIVLCSKNSELPNSVIKYSNIDKLKHDIVILSRYQDIYICGGSKIYTEFLPYMDYVYVTKVATNSDDGAQADTFFPNLDTIGSIQSFYLNEPFTCSFRKQSKALQPVRRWAADIHKPYRIVEFCCYERSLAMSNSN